MTNLKKYIKMKKQKQKRVGGVASTERKSFAKEGCANK